MQAIEVKYLPPTEKLPSRLKVIASCGSETYSTNDEYFYKYKPFDVELAAATRFANERNWLNHSTLMGGTIKNGNQVFVLVLHTRNAESWQEEYANMMADSGSCGSCDTGELLNMLESASRLLGGV